MPLVVCPDCSTAISPLAATCPNCGRPMSTPQASPHANPHAPSLDVSALRSRGDSLQLEAAQAVALSEVMFALQAPPRIKSFMGIGHVMGPPVSMVPPGTQVTYGLAPRVVVAFGIPLRLVGWYVVSTSLTQRHYYGGVNKADAHLIMGPRMCRRAIAGACKKSFLKGALVLPVLGLMLWRLLS